MRSKFAGIIISRFYFADVLSVFCASPIYAGRFGAPLSNAHYKREKQTETQCVNDDIKIWRQNNVARYGPRPIPMQRMPPCRPPSFLITDVRLLLHPATPHWKTYSMAVRAIFFSVCRRGPPKGYQTRSKRCSDAQYLFNYQHRWHKCTKWLKPENRKDPFKMTCIHWYYSHNTASISDMN